MNTSSFLSHDLSRVCPHDRWVLSVTSRGFHQGRVPCRLMPCTASSPHPRGLFAVAEAALWAQPERQRFSRVWPRHTRRHAPQLFCNPRRRKRQNPRAALLCPHPGATMTVRLASKAWPAGVRTFVALRACAVAGASLASASGVWGVWRPVALAGAHPPSSRAGAATSRSSPVSSVAGMARALPASAWGRAIPAWGRVAQGAWATGSAGGLSCAAAVTAQATRR